MERHAMSPEWENLHTRRRWVGDPPSHLCKLNEVPLYGISVLQLENITVQEFPGSPVVRIGAFTAEGPSLIPGQGTKIPQAVLRGQKKKM